MHETAIAYGPEMSTTADRVPGIVDEFHQLAESLTHEIHLLSERLSPILKPDYNEQGKEPAMPEPVKSSVRSAHDTILRQIQRLASIRSQLEV